MTEFAAITKKIVDTIKVKSVIHDWKASGNKIVFTNGCFDILHYGHVSYLSAAKDLGNKLIIGLNSDASVRRLKGETRPINGQYQRAVLLAALQFVDAVVVFDEDTPEKLIKIVEPDFLVKGSDYTVENIVGANFVMSYGGKVITIPLVENFSSSSIIKKIAE